ncbi:hypothetical protein JOQ06_003503, partial [Pogonophryne albipinna]
MLLASLWAACSSRSRSLSSRGGSGLCLHVGGSVALAYTQAYRSGQGALIPCDNLQKALSDPPPQGSAWPARIYFSENTQFIQESLTSCAAGGIDLMATFTKCCGAHELLDSDLSGSVVKNVTEREECELIALRLLPKRAQCAILQRGGKRDRSRRPRLQHPAWLPELSHRARNCGEEEEV